jgi:hypothetical protein
MLPARFPETSPPALPVHGEGAKNLCVLPKLFFKAMLAFALLLGACDSIPAFQTPPTTEQTLVETVADELRAVTEGLGTLTTGCGSMNANPPAEEAYTAALHGALVHLLADPRAQNFDFEKLRDIFLQGTPYTDVYFYPGDGDTFIVSLRRFVCMASTERPQTWTIYVMNRRGDSWLIGRVGNTPRYEQVQWAGDRWVMLHSTPEYSGYADPRLLQVARQGDGWGVVADFPLDGIVNSWPNVLLDEGYERIRLRISTYNPATPPCTLEQSQTEGAEHFYYDVDTVLEWDGTRYAVVDEMVARVSTGRETVGGDVAWTRLDGATLDCINLGVGARLAEFIRDDVPFKPDPAVIPHADPCYPDFDRGLVDTYHAALVGALAQMMAHPEAQSLSAEELAAAFSRVSDVRALVEGDGYFLTAIPGWTPQCSAGRHIGSTVLLSVINSQGDIWPLEPLHGAEGRGPSIAPQWAGDRWMAVVNNNARTCAFCWSIWQIKQEGDGWTVSSLLDFGRDGDVFEEWVNAPELTLLDGYERIALNLSPQYVEPQCTFSQWVQPDLYMTWQEIRREYVWDAEGYQQVDETNVATHVVISAPDLLGRRTYQQLANWEAFCEGS